MKSNFKLLSINLPNPLKNFSTWKKSHFSSPPAKTLTPILKSDITNICTVEMWTPHPHLFFLFISFPFSSQLKKIIEKYSTVKWLHWNNTLILRTDLEVNRRLWITMNTLMTIQKYRNISLIIHWIIIMKNRIIINWYGCDNLQNDLNVVYEWATENNMKFNNKKFQYVCYHAKHSRNVNNV